MKTMITATIIAHIVPVPFLNRLQTSAFSKSLVPLFMYATVQVTIFMIIKADVHAKFKILYFFYEKAGKSNILASLFALHTAPMQFTEFVLIRKLKEEDLLSVLREELEHWGK